MRSVSALLSVVLLGVVAGCAPAGAPMGQIAVVDVTYLMQQTGQDLAMQQTVQQRVMLLDQQLKSMRQQKNSLLVAKQKEFGETPTPEQQATLQKMNSQFIQELQTAEAEAERNVSLIREQFFTKFREKMTAISNEIAKERGYSMIMAQNDGILLVDASLDVTDIFVERYRKMTGDQPAAVAPSTGLPVGAPDFPALPPAQDAPAVNQAPLPPPADAKPPVTITLPQKVDSTETPEPATPEKAAEAESATAPATE